MSGCWGRFHSPKAGLAEPTAAHNLLSAAPFPILHSPRSMLQAPSLRPPPLDPSIGPSMDTTTLAVGIPGQVLTGIRRQRLFPPYQ
jgi:hypothetical protein